MYMYSNVIEDVRKIRNLIMENCAWENAECFLTVKVFTLL